MIQFVELECPNCGGNLEKTGNKMAKCNHCGAEFLIDEGQPRQVTNIYQAPQKSDMNLSALVVIGIVIVLLLFVAVMSIENSTSTATSTAPVQQLIEEKGITSELFQQFVEKVYGVSHEKVTEKQLAKITYLHLFCEKDCNVIEYAMEEGSIERVELPAYLSIECSDLKYFTGLKGLDLKYTGLIPGDLDGLTELTEIWTNNSPDELIMIVPNPEKITVLGCYSADSLLGIDTFVNLEQFYVADSDLTDITALSALKKLKRLEIERGDAITDFGVLQSLTGLEYLSISSEKLKDVSFLKNMPELQEFSLKDSIVLDISSLNGMTSIKTLCLEDNDEIQDMSVLSSLSGLESLTLELGSSQQMPSADNWKNLTSLTIDGADDISFLTALPTLKFLSMEACSSESYSALAALQNLESLTIRSMYGDIPGFDVLSGLINLKYLDISTLTVYGNAEAIFAIPGLEELNVNDCSFGLNFEAIPENTSLKRLYMNRLELWENISASSDGMFTYLDYDEINLADHIEFLSKFPNLEEVYLQSNKLTGVEFTESLPNLKKLDITGNYVTDLRPLGKLKDLQIVWCGENAISQGSDLGGNVTVIKDSKADEDALWK